MNLNDWKEIQKSTTVKECLFRDMFGYVKDYTSSELAVYYPKIVISSVQKSMPPSTFKDIYYVIEKWHKDSHIYELLLLQLVIENQSIEVDLSFEKRRGIWELRFSYLVNGNSETTKETEEIMYTLYHCMREFLEENSPNRLFLLTSPITFFFPTWLNQIINS